MNKFATNPMTRDPKILTVLGQLITEAAADPRTAANIREMHSTPEGAEMLRLIVRDNLGGAADLIANAIWDNP